MSVGVNINPHFYKILYSPKRYKILYGGRGGGKSNNLARYFMIKMLQPEYFRLILGRAVQADIRASQYQEIVDVIEDHGLQDSFIFRRNVMEIECRHNGNKCFAKGLQKSSNNRSAKVKSIKDPTDVWLEEADELTEDDFIKLDTSLRTVKSERIHIWLSFNPENDSHWICKKWFKDDYSHNEDDQTIINHSTYLVNRDNLQKSYVQSLESLEETNPDWAKVFVRGEWGGGRKGRIFKDYKLIKSEEFERIDGYRTYGVDFGYNHPMVLMECKLYEGGLYFKQKFYERNKQAEDLIKYMDNNGISTYDPIYCDHADPGKIDKIALAGYNAQNADKRNVIARINTMNSFPLHFVEDDTETLKELKKYVWIIDPKTSQPLDKPVKIDDDALDACGYACHSDYHIKIDNIA